MSNDNPELRKLLDDVAAGRISAADAEWQLKNLPPDAATESAPATRIVRNQKSGKFPWPAALIMALIGSILLGVGYYTAHKTIDYLAHGAKVEGSVVRMVRGSGSSKGSKPVVKYAVDGRDFEISGEISSSPPAFHVGETVEVLYMPADPATAVINSFSERWLFPVIFGGIGVVVGLAGWGILLVKLLSLFFRARPATIEEERFRVE
jgi:hypothetical protein